MATAKKAICIPSNIPTTQEDHEGNSWWNTLPHGSLAVEESVNRHSKAEAKRGVHLGLKLTNVTCEDQHGKTRSKENVDDPIRKASESGSFNWTSGHVHAENDDGNLELTSQKVTVEVISAVLVKFLVHGGKIAFLHLLLLSALS